MTSPGGHRRTARTVAAAALVVTTAAGLLAAPVAASPDAPAGDLVLTAPRAFFTGLAPGDVRYWRIEAELRGAQRASLTLRLWGSGEVVAHPHGLVVGVEACDGTLTPGDVTVRPVCSGPSATVVPPAPLAALSVDDDHTGGPAWTVPAIEAGADASFVVTLGLPMQGASDSSLMGLHGNIGVGLYAASVDEAVPAGPRTSRSDDVDRLSLTGPGAAWRTVLLGAVLLVAGVVLRAGVRASAGRRGRR